MVGVVELLQIGLVQIGRRLRRVLPGIDTLGRLVFPFYSPSRVPWASLEKPLNEARVALITTAGLYLTGQEPFDMGNLRGDLSYRTFPSTVAQEDIRLSPVQFDSSQIEKDFNVVFPLTRLKELEREGVIGEVAPHHFSFLGYITNRAALVSRSLKKLVKKLKADAVDAVLLIPACVVCNQSVGLIHHEIERAGIPTISIYFIKRAMERLKPPRALLLPADCGNTLGSAYDREYQERVVRKALMLLETAETPGTHATL